MKINKSENLVWICIIATIIFFGGSMFVNFKLIYRIILIILGFAGLFGIVIFSKNQNQYSNKPIENVLNIDKQIHQQEQIIQKNIEKIKNIQQQDWKIKNQQINQDNEYVDLSDSGKSLFEQQLQKKYINSNGYLDLTLVENYSEEYIKNKIDKMLENKPLKIKSPQTKHHDDVVINVDKDKTVDISNFTEEIKLKDEECLDLTKKEDISPKLTEKEKIMQQEILEMLIPDIKDEKEQEEEK